MNEQKKKRDKVTIGLDLGDRRHRFCVLGGNGEVVEEGSLLNERLSLKGFIGRYPGALVVMEAGCHSPWISRYLEALGCESSEFQSPNRPGTYNSSLPVRPGVVVTLANVPYDLTKAEAERLVGFIRLLAVDAQS
jgi:hypothetical protein